MDEHQRLDDAKKNRRLYYIGAGIGAVVLIFILVLTIVLLARSSSNSSTVNMLKSSNGCSISSTVPNMEALMRRKKNIASSSRMSLANMVGYIFVYDAGFEPIVLSQLDDYNGRLKLTSECATLTWRYHSESYETYTTIHMDALNLESELKLPNGTRSLSCDISSHAGFSFDSSRMFSCTKRLTTICHADPDQNGYKEPVAELVLESLEFEMLFNETIKDEQFDRPTQPGCCYVINN